MNCAVWHEMLDEDAPHRVDGIWQAVARDPGVCEIVEIECKSPVHDIGYLLYLCVLVEERPIFACLSKRIKNR